MPRGRRRDEIEQVTLPVLNSFNCIGIPPEAGDHYARIKFQCQTKGRPLDENDLWIAAMALLLDATLVTRDTDFNHVPGLKIEDWTK
jgi:tRNA(fMet)-specific endonuclease VapC